MAILRVWSERNEPAPTRGWHDCVYSAFLEALEGAGLARLAGVDRVAEREALERSQNVYAPEAGSSLAAGEQAVRNRYGLTPARSLSLAPLLDTPGLVIVAAGVNSRMPARLHRWDPAFTGSHAVCFATSETGITILDPEAPDKYAGDPITRAEALAWWDRTSVRYWRIGELEGSMRTITIATFPAPRIARLAAGATAEGYISNRATPASRVKAPAERGTWAHVDAAVKVEGPMAGGMPAGDYYRAADGALLGLFVPVAQLALEPAKPDPLRKAAQDAVAALQAALK